MNWKRMLAAGLVASVAIPSVQAQTLGTEYCAANDPMNPISCPCGFPSGVPTTPLRGCSNLDPLGARLLATSPTGTAVVAADDVKLSIQDSLSTVPCLFVMSTSQDTSGATSLGDGVICLGTPRVILNVSVTNVQGIAEFPAGSGPSITAAANAAGMPISPGTYYFQAWYRNRHEVYCAGNYSNTTQGIALTWQ